MVDEYSLSYPGPSERFLGSFYVARRAGLRTIAKLQIGATHELATVANLPLIGNLYEKARAMRRLGIRGYMGTWNFGNRITANPAAFNRFFLAKRLPLKRRAMTDFARDYLPGCDAASAVEAWRQFVRAMDYYPFSIPFLYGSCVNWSLGYPLKPGPAADTPSGRAWLLDKRGDQLKHGAFSLAKVIHALGRVARLWRPGCVLFDKAVAACSCAEARLERDNAWMAYHSFRSAWNSYRVFRLRQAWSDTMLPEYRRIIADELENVEAALPIVQRDPRFGFHIEAHGYMYDAASVARKARSLRRQLAQG
jgi:hypothetical protein